MKLRNLSFFLMLTSVVFFALFSTGSALAAHLRHAPGPVAGMLKNGAIYITATNDDYWHQVSPSTLAKLGYTRSNITWYGARVPGTIAPQSTPSTQKIADMSLPRVNLAGLLSTGRIYIARGDLFYPITTAALLKKGYSLSWVKWFGSLPGSVAPQA